MVWLPVFGIFNMRTALDACDGTLVGCTDALKESALEGDWEKNTLPHQGLEPMSVLRLAFH